MTPVDDEVTTEITVPIYRGLFVLIGPSTGAALPVPSNVTVQRYPIMALSFPNPSRSYDAAAHRIRFIGHDGMFEVPFLVEVDVFADANTEAAYLAAFDNAREGIQNVARKAYSYARKRMYVLTQADFR